MPDFDLDSALQAARAPTQCTDCGYPLAISGYSLMGDHLNVRVNCNPCNAYFRWRNDFQLIYRPANRQPFFGRNMPCPECRAPNGCRCTLLLSDGVTQAIQDPPTDTLLASWRCVHCEHEWQDTFDLVSVEHDDTI